MNESSLIKALIEVWYEDVPNELEEARILGFEGDNDYFKKRYYNIIEAGND